MQENQELHTSVENVETLCVIFVHNKDPASDNEMHRVHQDPSPWSITYETGQIYACPHCEENLKLFQH